MINCLSQVVLVSQSSRLTQGSVLEVFPSVTRNCCVILNKDIKLEEVYLSITRFENQKQAFSKPNEFLIVICARNHV